MSQQLRHDRRQERIAGKYRVKFVRRTLRFRETRVCKFVEYTGVWLIPDRRWGNNRQNVILRIKISEKGRITVSSWQALFSRKINLKVYTFFSSNMFELYFFFLEGGGGRSWKQKNSTANSSPIFRMQDKLLLIAFSYLV